MKKLTFLILFACAALSAVAATFNVSPIRVGLSPQRPTMPLSVTNEGDEPVVIQVQAVRWSQENGDDVYARTDEILATPPIFTIPGHGSQIIRVGLRRPFQPERELSYRLYLVEQTGALKPEFTGVQMSLRIGLPVFVMGSAAAKPALHWTVVTSAPGVSKLRVANHGNAHAQVADIRLMSIATERTIARQQVPAYLLPGTIHEWALKFEPGETIGMERVRLQAYMDSGDVNTELTPQQKN